LLLRFGDKKRQDSPRVNPQKVTIAILAALSASIALADDFKTINGKEYKNATVRRVEADGLVLKSKSGISKLYFTELPKEVQQRFNYDPNKAVTSATPAKQPSPPEESSPATTGGKPKAPNQLDDAQFDDLRRRDWYEDLKKQEKLKNNAAYMLSLMDFMEKDVSDCTRCTPTYFQMLAAERNAHRENYRALSAIAAKISATKSYDDYRKLKPIENRVLAAIETQKLKDANDVGELRLRVSEDDAVFLEIWQRSQ
jgi:hypothetical protein